MPSHHWTAVDAWVCHFLLITSQAEGQSGCFQFLEINGKAALNKYRFLCRHSPLVSDLSFLFLNNVFHRTNFKSFWSFYELCFWCCTQDPLPKGDTSLFICCFYSSILYASFYSFIFRLIMYFELIFVLRLPSQLCQNQLKIGMDLLLDSILLCWPLCSTVLADFEDKGRDHESKDAGGL